MSTPPQRKKAVELSLNCICQMTIPSIPLERLHADLREIESVRLFNRVITVTLGAVDSMRPKLPAIKSKISIDGYDTVYIAGGSSDNGFVYEGRKIVV